MVWASSGDGIAYKTTDGKADAAEYDDGLSVLEEFGVRFVLDEADSECDRAGQQEDDAEVEQGDPTTQTLVSIPGACLVPETLPLHTADTWILFFQSSTGMWSFHPNFLFLIEL